MSPSYFSHPLHFLSPTLFLSPYISHYPLSPSFLFLSSPFSPSLPIEFLLKKPSLSLSSLDSSLSFFGLKAENFSIQNSLLGHLSFISDCTHFLKVFVSVIKTKVDNRWRSASARLFFVIDCFVCIVHSFDCFSVFVKGKFISVTRS